VIGQSAMGISCHFSIIFSEQDACIGLNISFSKNPCDINLKSVVLAKSIPCGIPASQ
jgi:hypothetical protein